ncbi:PcfJ domain-containing protein [Sphingobium subterraneum]|uniref:Uncharacterized protein n=1 Tax=Sphingobium subterraneum TaxID=627688 RepID=A0A841IX03_9SPHN|nr:PcfJ domain-containing protein [Sphingobium subterraneum]MBB6122904.1 hypothetical protein [Sphingobium subterraneum]
MTSPSFAAMSASARQEIEAIVPEAVRPQLSGSVAPFASLIALSRCRWSMCLSDNDIVPLIKIVPAPRGNVDVRALVDRTIEAVRSAFFAPNSNLPFGLDAWIGDQGFLRVVTALVKAGADVDAIHKLAEHLGRHMTALNELLQTRAIAHCREVVRRDIGPEPAGSAHCLAKVVQWASAPEYAKSHHRPEVLLRRRQALEAYGSLSGILMESSVTDAIDKALPLKDRLKERLGIDEAQLRRLTGILTIEEGLAAPVDLSGPLRVLLLHEVPLHQWPTGNEWRDKLWRPNGTDGLLRPDYIAGETQRTDAVNALRMDLLTPLAAERVRILGISGNYRVDSFVTHLSRFDRLANGPLHRLWLRTIREAVLGSRGVKSFGEAVELWHRRAATLSAVRHEAQADQPGWPGLCDRWNAADGIHLVSALTGADDLVAEGNALDHCVGGYYQQCRRGATQILSLQAEGKRVATLELLIEEDANRALSITMGQFKARRNARPEPHLWQILKEFLEDLKTGRHAIHAAPIRAYRKQMARGGDYARGSGALPIDHARRAWPFYRSLLPKSSPPSFDDWCEMTGLTRMLDMILCEIADVDPPKAGEVP